MANDGIDKSGLEVVRINIKTGEAVTVRKALCDQDNAPFWFIGLKDRQYLYLADRKNLQRARRSS